MAVCGGVRRDPVRPLGGGAARRAGRRLLRVDVGLLHHGLDDPDQRRRRGPLAAPVAPVHAVARGDGDHRPRPRRAPAAPRRREAAARLGDGGAGDRPAGRPHQEHGAPALAPLHRAHRRARGRARGLRRRRDRPSDGALRGRLGRPRDDADRGLHAHVDLAGRLRGGVAMGRRRVHGVGRDQLRAHLPRDRAPALAQRRQGRGAPALPRDPHRRVDRARRRDLGGRPRRRRGRSPPRRLSGRLDHDHDGICEHGLRLLGRRSG